MPAMHHKGDGDAVGVGVGHNLQHLGTQPGEGRMKRSRPGGEIGQREVLAIDPDRIGIESSEPIFELIETTAICPDLEEPIKERVHTRKSCRMPPIFDM